MWLLKSFSKWIFDKSRIGYKWIKKTIETEKYEEKITKR